MALDYFDIGGRIGQEVGKKKKKTSPKGPDARSFGSRPGNKPSANTEGGDAAAASAAAAAAAAAVAAKEAAQRAAVDRYAAEMARRYATSGTESGTPGVRAANRLNNTPGLTMADVDQAHTADRLAEDIAIERRRPKGHQGGYGWVSDEEPRLDRFGNPVPNVTTFGGVGNPAMPVDPNSAAYWGSQAGQDYSRKYHASEAAEYQKTLEGDFDEENNQFSTIDWSNYDKLSNRVKAALDYNTGMYMSRQGDRRLQKERGGQDHRFTLNEVSDKVRDKYRAQYQRVFGAAADTDILYMPRIVAYLDRALGMRSVYGSADQYLKGEGFITEEDLNKGNQNRVNEYTQRYGMGDTSIRRQAWVSDLVDHQRAMTDAMQKAGTIINGLNQRVNLQNQGRGGYETLSDQAALSTTRDGNKVYSLADLTGDRANEEGWVLQGLRSKAQENMGNNIGVKFDDLSKELNSRGFSQKYLYDRNFMTKIAKNQGIDVNRWLEYARYMKKRTTQTERSAVDKALVGGE